MKKIASVQINLAVEATNSKPAGYMCDSVVLLDSSGAELKDFKELVGNTEYRSRHELILNVAYEIGVSTEVVSIIN